MTTTNLAARAVTPFALVLAVGAFFLDLATAHAGGAATLPAPPVPPSPAVMAADGTASADDVSPEPKPELIYVAPANYDPKAERLYVDLVVYDDGSVVYSYTSEPRSIRDRYDPGRTMDFLHYGAVYVTIPSYRRVQLTPSETAQLWSAIDLAGIAALPPGTDAPPKGKLTRFLIVWINGQPREYSLAGTLEPEECEWRGPENQVMRLNGAPGEKQIAAFRSAVPAALLQAVDALEFYTHPGAQPLGDNRFAVTFVLARPHAGVPAWPADVPPVDLSASVSDADAPGVSVDAPLDAASYAAIESHISRQRDDRFLISGRIWHVKLTRSTVLPSEDIIRRYVPSTPPPPPLPAPPLSPASTP